MGFVWFFLILAVLIVWRTIIVLNEKEEGESFGGLLKRFACGKTKTGC